MATAASVNAGATGFWRRQFFGAGTTQQKAFDCVFGAVVPVFSLMIPRQLFSESHDWGLLGNAVLWFMGVQITLLWLWYAGGRHVPFRPLLGILLSLGGVLSLASGVVLLFMLFPFIVAPIPLVPLALVPVFAGFVYLRIGVRAMTLYRRDRSRTVPVQRGMEGRRTT